MESSLQAELEKEENYEYLYSTNETLNLNSSLLKLYELHEEFKKYKNELESDCNIPDFVNSIADYYKKVHGYLALFVCIFGAMANTFIVVVLTRKEMRTPINLMLFTLAIADLLIMIEYIPFALHMYFRDQSPELKYSFTWAWFIFFHLHVTQILHIISVQLTLTIAIWRYKSLKNSNQISKLATFSSCYKATFLGCICPLFLCILNYFYFQIIKKTKYITFGPPPFNMIDEDDDEKLQIFNNACEFLMLHDCSFKKVDLYVVEMSELVKDHPILHTIHFWIFSVIIKLIPCIVLTFLMGWLLNKLYKAERHHTQLKMDTLTPQPSPYTNSPMIPERTNSDFKINRNPRSEVEIEITSPDSLDIHRFVRAFRQGLTPKNKLSRQSSNERTNLTSKILIVVLFLFLVTEFPQGIMHFLTGWYGIDFLKCNYNPLAEFFDILAILNAAVNFILYCFMSQEFRTQFRTFLKK